MPQQLKALHDRSQRLLEKIQHLSDEAAKLAEQVKAALEQAHPAEAEEGHDSSRGSADIRQAPFK
jgi:hypothetical protein